LSYSRRDAPTGSPLWYECCTSELRVPDRSILTEKQMEVIGGARSTFLRQQTRGTESIEDRVDVWSTLESDLMGGVEPTKMDWRDL